MRVIINIKLLLIVLYIFIFTNNILMAQEGMPVRFDTSSVYAYYTPGGEEGSNYWNPNFYYFTTEMDGTVLSCLGPNERQTPFTDINIHYVIYPHPGFINTFVEPGEDFNPFMEGIFPIIFLRPTLNFYDFSLSNNPYAFEESLDAEPTWVIPDSFLYGDGLGVPLQSMDQNDPIEGDLTIYARIFPFPPPWEEYYSNPIYSTPPIVRLWEGARDLATPIVLDGYMGVSLEVMEMYSNEREQIELFRLPYHYEECDPGCRQLAGYARSNGGATQGIIPDPANPEDNITYYIGSNAIEICARGISGGDTGISLPPGTVVNKPLTDFRMDEIIVPSNKTENMEDLNIYKLLNQNDTDDFSKEILQVSPPLGPYPDYVEVYRDDTGFHDAVATVNLTWVFESSTLIQQVEDELAPFLEECVYGDNCTIDMLIGDTGGNVGGIVDSILGGDILNLPFEILATYLQSQLPEEEVYDLLRNAYIDFQYAKLEYERTPYADERCPESFTVYTEVRNGTLEGPEDIFDLITYREGIIPVGRSTIDDNNADFPVLGMGTWNPQRNSFQSVSQLFQDLHYMDCEYTVSPTYYIDSSYGTEMIGGQPFTVTIRLYN